MEHVDWDDIFGIATHYVIVDAGIEIRWRRNFAHSSDWPWGPPSLL